MADITWEYRIQQQYCEERSKIIAENALVKKISEPNFHMNFLHYQADLLGIKSSREDFNKRASELQKESPLDEPEVRKIYEDIYREIKEIAEYLNINLGSYKISSLPSGSVSAFITGNTWEEKKYIFIDSDLSVFVLSISKILALCYSDEIKKNSGTFSSLSAMRKVIEDKEIIRQIKSLFFSCVIIGHARASRPWHIPEKLLPYAGKFAIIMDRFVLSHEIAHGWCGHLTGENASELKITEEDDKFYTMSHEQEYEADVSALYCVQSIGKLKGDPYIISSILSYALLLSLASLEAAHGVYSDVVSDLMSTHPPAKCRAEHLLKNAIDNSPNENVTKELKRSAFRMKKIFYWIELYAIECLRDAQSKGFKKIEKVNMSKKSLDRPEILGINNTFSVKL